MYCNALCLVGRCDFVSGVGTRFAWPSSGCRVVEFVISARFEQTCVCICFCAICDVNMKFLLVSVTQEVIITYFLYLVAFRKESIIVPTIKKGYTMDCNNRGPDFDDLKIL